MIKIVYGSVPKDGGTFTFYRNVRKPLKALGVELWCVSVGVREAALWDRQFADDHSVLLAAGEASLKGQAQEFAAWCDQQQIDIAIGVNSEAILSALPHLPERIRAIARCANAFHQGYMVTVVCYERLARIIALTPRLRDDLVRDYAVDPNRVELIPNGIDASLFSEAAKIARGDHEPLRLGFVGRLEHNQKGVLFLPDIVEQLDRRNVRFHLRIAGKGAHEGELRRRMEPFVSRGLVEFVGVLTSDEVPHFLGETDVFLFTSQFEGCPNALLEAMMAGCVPVSWTIDGITDFLIDDGVTGLLCPFGDIHRFAEYITGLNRDRSRLKKMAETGADVARQRFTNERTAAAYARVFREVMASPPPPWTPRPWSEFKVDAAFKKPWRALVPQPMRRLARRLAYYAGLTNRE